MSSEVICCVCRSKAIEYAAQYLTDHGLTVTTIPTDDMTHLLLPIPTGADYLEYYLRQLPVNTFVCGGNLDLPPLEMYRTVDFLKDPYYLADNASITADCSLEIVEEKLGPLPRGCPVLILGWGRIGKCLGRILQDKGADVTIAARKDTDLAMIHALDCRSIPISTVGENLQQYQVILNTVPEMILPKMSTRPDCIALELASKPGMAGPNIIEARGLPGKMAPEASGKLIAETFMRLCVGKE